MKICARIRERRELLDKIRRRIKSEDVHWWVDVAFTGEDAHIFLDIINQA
jgi:hypothetical protein